MSASDQNKASVEVASNSTVLRELLATEILLIGGGEAAGTAY